MPMSFTSAAERVRQMLLVLLCVALNGCVVGNLVMSIQVMRYSGDGVIYNCSSSPPILGPLFSWPGYRIEFPKFPSDRSHEASYRLSNVPQRGSHPAIVYLRFVQPDWAAARTKKKSVTALFRIMLGDTEGHIVNSAELPIGTSVWAGAGGPFGVYEPEKSQLFFAPHKSYILRVSYVPGKVPPPADELYFSIENQGSK
jgi:hypothetical protein